MNRKKKYPSNNFSGTKYKPKSESNSHSFCSHSQKKQTEDTVKMNEYKRNLQTMQKKLEDHDFLLTQESVEKPTYVQLQDDKICEL